MAKGIYYCEECVEEISRSDVFWENNRAYCGRCGGELDLDEEAADVVEHITGGKGTSPVRPLEDDDDEEDEDDLDSVDDDDEERELDEDIIDEE